METFCKKKPLNLQSAAALIAGTLCFKRAIKIFSCSLGCCLCQQNSHIAYLCFKTFQYCAFSATQNILVSFSNKIPENIIALKYQWTKYDFYNVLFPSRAEDASYTGHYCTTAQYVCSKARRFLTYGVLSPYLLQKVILTVFLCPVRWSKVWHDWKGGL